MSFASDWAASSKQIRQAGILQLLDGAWPPAIDYMEIVKTHGHSGVYASTGLNYNNAIFGRDSIIVAEDLLRSHQPLVHDIIISLAKLQGHQLDIQTEEEPGKIHHEYRTQHLIDETTAIPLSSLQRMVDLEHSWGIQGHDYFIYYGSHDATPLYVRLLGKYIETYGPAILEETYTNRTDKKYTVHDSVRSALSWITAKLQTSRSGLLEYKRLNSHALINQSWKDSVTGYLHTNGTIANGDRGIASVELQGYVYDALSAGAKLFATSEPQIVYWQKLAHQVQQLTIRDLWMPSVQFFAEGLDYDDHGVAHQIDTLTSNAAVILDSQLLHNLPDTQRLPIIDGTVRMIYSPQFVTDAGIRCRALFHQNIPGFVDYHGSFAVWPKETQAIAQGLRSHGYGQLAEQLENRILSSVLLSGEFYELFYVGTDHNVWYDPSVAIQYFRSMFPNDNAPLPEPGQAWTISAVLNILYNRSQPPATTGPANNLQTSLLATQPMISVPTTFADLPQTLAPSFTSPV